VKWFANHPQLLVENNLVGQIREIETTKIQEGAVGFSYEVDWLNEFAYPNVQKTRVTG
jgi:hypothetical protein